MSIFSRLFKRNRSYGEISVPIPTSHFMYITSPDGVSENFQISALDAERVVAALDSTDLFYFTTLFGRNSAVNFKLVQAVHIYEDAKISSSNRKIEGVAVYLAGREKYLDILCDQRQMENFFCQLKIGASFAQLGEWRFRTSDIVVVVAADVYTLPSETIPKLHEDAGQYAGLKAMFKEHGLE